MEKVIWKGSFQEAEEKELEYYASVDWKESSSIVEGLRKMFWSKEYKLNKGVEKIIVKASLQNLNNDFK